MPISRTVPKFYDYYEERPFDGGRGKRLRNIDGRFDPTLTDDELEASFPSKFPWWNARDLEGRADAPLHEGIWGISHWRAEKLFGDPTVYHLPWDTEREQWPPGISALARRYRLHHYFRVWSAEECIHLLAQHREVRVGIEVTEDWFDPPKGDVPDPSPDAPRLGSHAVPLIGYEPSARRFHFPNSWGERWGNQGHGSFSTQYFDDNLVEAWSRVGVGVLPPLGHGTGLGWLIWKSAYLGCEVHGRELVDRASGDRIAWAFLVRRGTLIDLEEFFVAPTARRQGYAKRLAGLVIEACTEMRATLRAWVPFADCEPENRPALVRLMSLLQLHLHPSPHRSAGFVGLATPLAVAPLEPRIPIRPASVRDNLAGTRKYTVWYGTNRKPVSGGRPGRRFSGERDNQVHYGQCQVAIPKSHRLGEIGSSWWKRWAKLTDDRLHVVEESSLSESAFWSDIKNTLGSYPSEERQALVFIHGYRMSFSQAAIWAAQIGFDLKFPGITAFFSWPSRGTFLQYPGDGETIQASEAAIAQFLDRFTRDSGATLVHLIAHSMGNRGLLRALQRLSIRGSDRTIRFGQIILAAPDVDHDVFRDLAHLYTTVADRTTLYASPSDQAVSLSRWIHDYPRVGLTPPVTVLSGIDTVEVRRLDLTDMRWHSYFAQASSVLHDMFDLLRRNAPPQDRFRLSQAKTETGEAYWVME